MHDWQYSRDCTRRNTPHRQSHTDIHIGCTGPRWHVSKTCNWDLTRVQHTGNRFCRIHHTHPNTRQNTGMRQCMMTLTLNSCIDMHDHQRSRWSGIQVRHHTVIVTPREGTFCKLLILIKNVLISIKM